MFPVDCEPLVAGVPDHPPDAVHAVALVEDQVNIELLPLETLVGFALSETVGGVAETTAVADLVDVVLSVGLTDDPQAARPASTKKLSTQCRLRVVTPSRRRASPMPPSPRAFIADMYPGRRQHRSYKFIALSLSIFGRGKYLHDSNVNIWDGHIFSHIHSDTKCR